jgi:Zn-dependent M28 family amino/carboxypeptidase
MKRFWFTCAAALAVAGCVPPAAVLEPVAVSPSAPVALDSARLLHDLGVLAHDTMEGRATGTPGGARARAFVERSFAERGLRPFGASYLQSFTFTRRDVTMEGVNVIGMVPGTARPDRYIVITAHYDHLGIRNGEIFNGADDNASGTAALFALAEHFVRYPPLHSLIFVAFDAEEMGLQGARAFVANPPVPRDAMVLNVNMDMIGRNDDNELYVAGTYHTPQLLPLIEAVAAVAEVRLIPGHDRPGGAAGDDWTMLSDHGAFHEAGIPFLYFGVEDHPDYHRPTDEFERIQPGFYNRAARTVLTAIRVADRHLAGEMSPSAYRSGRAGLRPAGRAGARPATPAGGPPPS